VVRQVERKYYRRRRMALHRRARDPADTDFLPPGAHIAQRVVCGSDYEAGRRVHSSRAQPAPAEIVRHGFKVPRARSESFPNAAEIGRKIKFLTVNAAFEPYQHLASI
jgi:hypothetical protein